MKKNFIFRLLQASLMCCLAVLFTACDEVFGSEDNPIPAYLSMDTSNVTLKVGESKTRTAIAVSTAIVEYSSSDPAIATVDANGTVTGEAEGTATITATATGYSSASGKKIFVEEKKSYVVTVQPAAPPMLATPLTIEALEDGATVTFKALNSAPANAIEYSKDGGATWTAGNTGGTGVSVNLAKAGDKVMFRGENAAYATSGNDDYNHIGCDKNIKVYGNIMSLIKKTGFETVTALTDVHAFKRLFKDNVNLIDASDLLLPAETLTNYCYTNMFYGCANLTAAPKELPATTLAVSCYSSMFNGCTKLITAPKLPATTLANYCYSHMFYNCTKLAEAWVKAGYNSSNCTNMFSGCAADGTLHTDGASWAADGTKLPASWTITTYE